MKFNTILADRDLITHKETIPLNEKQEHWHWLGRDGCIAAYSGQPYAGHRVRVGETLRIQRKPIPCERGFHASEKALDALEHAPGPVICRVRLGGLIVAHEDGKKVAAQERTVLWMADATDLLHEFACWCAEQALLREREAGREPDARLWAAIEAKRRWLRGEITDEGLADAREAAWDATRAAARGAAWYAAWGAAWEAAWDAAWDATRDAAREATRDAAREATREAVRGVQNVELERRLRELMGRTSRAESADPYESETQGDTE